MKRSTFLRLGGAALGLAALSGCAGLGGPRTLVLDEGELQKLVERAFPVDRRLLDRLDVSIGTPRIRLLPERNRLATQLEIEARDPLFSGQWRGRLALDSALRWEASDRSVRLQQVRVNDFGLDAGGSRRTQIDRLGAVVAERVLEDLAIYRLTPERAAALADKGMTPAAVTVTSRGVEITFQPATR